jgi:hypothetical protein
MQDLPWMTSSAFLIPLRMTDHKEKSPMSSQAITPNTEAAILARILESDPKEITPEVARYLLAMKLPASDEERVNVLSAKAREGSLTDAETQELDSYLHIGSLLSVMQSRARRLIKNTEAVPRPQ